MKSRDFKSGQCVLFKPDPGSEKAYKGTFICRQPRYQSRPAFSVIRIDEFAGLNGPDDKGDVHLSDLEVIQRVQSLIGIENTKKT